MKLDVQQGTRPIIRLHDFDHAELQQLRNSISRLTTCSLACVRLHEQSFVQPLDGCRFSLLTGFSNLGIQPTIEPNLFGWVAEPHAWLPFACILTPVGWSRVLHGVDLLLQLHFLCSVYVWLHKQWDGHGSIAWLLSPDGEW
jgi:hypothetical protein